MFRIISIAAVLTCVFLLGSFISMAQDIKKPKPAPKTSSRPDTPNSFNTRKQENSAGIYFGADFSSGIGLSDVNIPYCNYFLGLNALVGYAWNNSLLTGVGMGYNSYNEGSHYPFFADIRYTFGSTRSKPFAEFQTGYLLKNDKDSGHPRYYINPSAGVAFPFSKKVSLTLSVGLYTQWLLQDGRRDSFANLRLGFTFR